jgi:ribosome maturation factor RimP
MNRKERDTMTRATVHRLVEPVVERLGYELILVELVHDRQGTVLRLFVDQQGGVTLEDCARVSREVGAMLDVEDPIEGPYHLEVSSPGLDRPLVRQGDFVRFAGQKARIVTQERVGGRRTFRGVLQGVEGDRVLLLVDGQLLRIPLAEIARANVQYQF